LKRSGARARPAFAQFPYEGPAEIIAHRGYSARAPENTLAAVEAAITAGADAVEFDLHVSADGFPVLFHDEELDRTSDGSGPLRSLKLAQLAELDAGSWFAGTFAGEPIPSFRDALAKVRGRIGRVYPEVKHYGGPADLARMVELVSEAALLDSTVFISMDWDALARMRSFQPKLNVGYIVEKASRSRAAIELASGDPRALVDFDHRLLLADPALTDLAHGRGVELAVWTVNEPSVASGLLALGVRRITTNQVGDLLAWKRAL
jgi:glycerophosphoryl diester phosphodiesterase